MAATDRGNPILNTKTTQQSLLTSMSHCLSSLLNYIVILETWFKLTPQKAFPETPSNYISLHWTATEPCICLFIALINDLLLLL